MSIKHFFVAFMLLTQGFVRAQDVPEHDNQVLEAETGHSFTVQITELRLNIPLDPAVSSDDLANQLKRFQEQGQVEMTETVRIQATEGAQGASGPKSKVQFGSTVAVTSGSVSTPAGRSRQTQSIQVGTNVEVALQRRDNKIFAQLHYEASRLDGAGIDDTPPPISTVQCEMIIGVTPGKPRLLSGLGTHRSTILIISIEPL